jgi:hypothetical protein
VKLGNVEEAYENGTYVVAAVADCRYGARAALVM